MSGLKYSTFLLAFLLLSVISQPNLSLQSAFLETSLPTAYSRRLLCFLPYFLLQLAMFAAS